MTYLSLNHPLMIWTLALLMVQYRDEVLLKKIAKRIKQLREAKGMTQEQVFHELEIHVARIETAKHNISVSTLSKICEYFGVTLAEFFKKLD